MVEHPFCLMLKSKAILAGCSVFTIKLAASLESRISQKKSTRDISADEALATKRDIVQPGFDYNKSSG